MTSNTFGDLEWFANASEDQLYAELGRLLLGEGLGVGGMDPGAWRRFGKEWFTSNTEKLQELVCSSEFVRAAVLEAPQDIAGIAMLVLPLLKDQQLACAVAAIMLRSGLVLFCSTWQGHGSAAH